MFPGAQTLKHQGFRDLFWGGVTSQFGDAVYYLVFLFYARKATGSDEVVAMVAAASGLPFVLLGPYAAVLADRVDRRRIMLAADLASALVMLVVSAYAVVAGDLPAPAIVATAFLLSSVNAFFSPARRASVPRLVPREDLQAANGFLVSSQQLMQLGGLALSVTLIGVIEALSPRHFLPVTALVNGLTFLVSAGFCWRLPLLMPEREGEHPHPMQDLKEGFHIVRKDPVLRVALPMAMVMSTVISGWMVAYVAANEQWFGGRYWTLGVVECSFFLTVLVCNIWASRMKLTRPGWLYGWGWLTCGLAVLPMAWATWYPAYVGLNMLCGVLLPASWLATSQYLQTAFPDSVRGRVSGAWEMAWGAATPVGALLIGPSLQHLGLERTYQWMGAVIVVVAGAALSVRSFREAVMPEAGCA